MDKKYFIGGNKTVSDLKEIVDGAISELGAECMSTNSPQLNAICYYFFPGGFSFHPSFEGSFFNFYGRNREEIEGMKGSIEAVTKLILLDEEEKSSAR